MKPLVHHSLIAAAAFAAGLAFPRAGSPELPPPGTTARRPAVHQTGARDSLSAPVPHSESAARSAWETALTLEDGSWRELETLRAWRCLAEKNPALAWSESFRLTAGAELRALLSPDAVAAAQWLTGTPPEHRANAALELSALLLSRSPDETLQFAATLPDADQRSDAQLAVVAQWSRTDPAAAAAWCLAQPGRDDSLAAVMQSWAATDVMAASEWLAAQPVALPDAARLSLIEPLLELDPASAQAWAHTLADAELRRLTQERIATVQ